MMGSVGLLRATDAARRLSIPTKDLLRLVYERRIDFVMVDGIAHFRPEDVDVFRSGR